MTIDAALSNSARAHLILSDSKEYSATLQQIAKAFVRCLKHGHRVYLCGNGGSAADAQHVAAEFTCRFKREREPWPVMALTTDTSAMTAIGNDYSFEDIFARQVAAFARRGDIVVGISTSGNSRNVLNALATARICEATTIGFTGAEPGHMAALCELLFKAPDVDTGRVQELHISAWHAVIERVEAELSQR